MSAPLGALGEVSLLSSLLSPSASSRSESVARFKAVNAIAGSALEARDRIEHPPPSELDRLLQQAKQNAALVGDERMRQIEQQARIDPLKLTSAQLLLASNPLRSSVASASPAASSSSSSKSHARKRSRVPSYLVDPDIVRGRSRRFQTQLYALIWGESTETDTEGVHPIVSSSKQAQDLFQELNVADVLLYGRTGSVANGTTTQTGNGSATPAIGSAAPTSRSGNSTARTTRRTRSATRGPVSPTRFDPAGANVVEAPVAPLQWFYMQKQPVTNEKKLCRKVEFDHRHVVPEFENRESETPMLGAGAAAMALPQTASAASAAKSAHAAVAGAPKKGLVKTCEIICERFRLDPSLEDEEAAEAAAAAAQAAVHAHQAPGELEAMASSSASATSSAPPSPGSILRSLSAVQSPSRTPSGGRKSISGVAGRPPARPSRPGSGLAQQPQHAVIEEEKDSTTGAAGAASADPDALHAPPVVQSALSNFQHRMAVHGRTDPSQTKLDKLYFNKDDLRTFLRQPYGKGALLKFVLSKQTSNELIRCTWVDKGPRGENEIRAASSSEPTPQRRSPFASRAIKFLVQTRTNSFRLNDSGYSFFERTLTYPHPGDHRIAMHDLESEFDLGQVVGNVARQAEYLKQRRADREQLRLQEERERRLVKSMTPSMPPSAQPTSRMAMPASAVGTARASLGANLTSPAVTSRVEDGTSESASDATASPAVAPLSQADDASSLIAAKSNQHYTIRNYEAGSKLHTTLRGVCDKLAAYFDLVLASSKDHASSKRRTKKMQLYFRRDACDQLWLLWSDCLEFEDPVVAAAQAAQQGHSLAPSPFGSPAPSPSSASRGRSLRNGIPNHAVEHTLSPSRAASASRSRRSIGAKIAEEKEGPRRSLFGGGEEDDEAAFSDGEHEDGLDDDEDETGRRRLPRIMIDSIGGSSGLFDEGPSGSSSDEDGPPQSWRAPRERGAQRRKNQRAASTASSVSSSAFEGLAGQAPRALGETEREMELQGSQDDAPSTPQQGPGSTAAPKRVATCAHCRVVTQRYDLYHVQLQTLLHTYRLEAPQQGYFHQHKAEWSATEWQSAPVSLAEAKESARKHMRASMRAGAAGASVSTRERAAEGLSPPGTPSRPGSARPTGSGPTSPMHSATSRGAGYGSGFFAQSTLQPPSLALGPTASPPMSPSQKRPSGLGPVSPQATATAPVTAFEEPPSFVLFLAPGLTASAWATLQHERSFLSRELPLCGKCTTQVYMDPLLVRAAFGQSINPIQHTAANTPSLGAADGSGNGKTNGPAFAWLAKKNMSPYDRAHGDSYVPHIAGSTASNAAQRSRSVDGSPMSSPEPSQRPSRRTKTNFISLNVSASRSGLHHVPSSIRKAQRELSTWEGKDIYTCPRALENKWAHYPDAKEDRDQAQSLQGRLIRAGALPPQTAQRLRRKPEDMEQVYGLEFVTDQSGIGGYVAAGATSQSALRMPRFFTTREPIKAIKSPSRKPGSAPHHASLSTPLSVAFKRADAQAQKKHDTAMDFGGGDFASPDAPQAHHRQHYDHDNTFLTGVDADADQDDSTVAERRHFPSLELSLSEISSGVARRVAPEVEKAPLATSDEPTETNEVTPPPPGSRMDQRVAAKVARDAERAERERELAALKAMLAGSSPSKTKSNRRSSAPGKSPQLTVMAHHEPRPSNATIMDRPLPPAPGSPVRRAPNQPPILMDRELRAQTWTRVHQVLDQRRAHHEDQSTKALVFRLPWSAQPTGVASQVEPEEADQVRQQRAEVYRNIRRSQSIQRLRSEQGVFTSSTSRGNSPERAKKHTLNPSRSASSLLGPLEPRASPGAYAASTAYSIENMAGIGSLSAATIRSQGLATLMLHAEHVEAARETQAQRSARLAKGGIIKREEDEDEPYLAASPMRTPGKRLSRSGSAASTSSLGPSTPSRSHVLTASNPIPSPMSPAVQQRLTTMQRMYRVPSSQLIGGVKALYSKSGSSPSKFAEQKNKTSTLHVLAMPSDDPSQPDRVPLTRAALLVAATSPSPKRSPSSSKLPSRSASAAMRSPTRSASTRRPAAENAFLTPGEMEQERMDEPEQEQDWGSLQPSPRSESPAPAEVEVAAQPEPKAQLSPLPKDAPLTPIAKAEPVPEPALEAAPRVQTHEPEVTTAESTPASPQQEAVAVLAEAPVELESMPQKHEEQALVPVPDQAPEPEIEPAAEQAEVAPEADIKVAEAPLEAEAEPGSDPLATADADSLAAESDAQAYDAPSQAVEAEVATYQAEAEAEQPTPTLAAADPTQASYEDDFQVAE